MRYATSKARLAHYRAMAVKYPDTDWRYWKSSALWTAPNNARGPDGRIYSESLAQYGVDLGEAHTLARIGHTGWYADNFQDSLIIGHVIKLRCPRGVLYIPATMCTGWDGTIHYMGDASLVPKGASQDEHDEAMRDIAIRADRCAEIEAEEARESDAQSQAEMRVDDARENIHRVNKACLALLAEIKRQVFQPFTCEALRHRVNEYLEERAEAWRIINKGGYCEY